MPSTSDRIAALARADKWYLSCGDGYLWAPPFPLFLHATGFWDEAHIYYHPLQPLFAIALLDAQGREVELRQIRREWQPGRLVCTYTATDGEELIETKTVEPGGCFRSQWRAARGAWGDLASALVAFTVQPGPDVHGVQVDGAQRGLGWRRTLRDRREIALEVTASLRIETTTPTAAPVSFAACRSEGFVNQPIWSFTPFAEAWGEALDGAVDLQGIDDTGSVYLAVALALGDLDDATVAIDLCVSVEGYGPSPARAAPRARSEDLWRDYFSAFPSFSCSDPYISRFYDYRIYGLFLNRYARAAGNVRHPAIAEGIGYFHVPITYSAQCHMFEMRWADLPVEENAAHGSLLNFLEHQREDGSFHGRIYTNHLVGTDFYHANWGDALLAVHATQPNEAYLRRCYEGLTRYARWLDETRDRERCGMYDVVNHFETGQEYMSRYQAVNPQADLAGWKDETRLKAIDITVYAYQLQRTLQQVAALLDRGDEAQQWRAAADRTGDAILMRMWNPQVGMFSDVDPHSGERTNVKATVCFYPLLTDLLDEAHITALLEHLTNPGEFWTTHPLPSSSLDDPLFNAEARWKGKRHVCPWNGRTWPMTNSHVIDGLLRQWRRRDAAAAASTPRHRCGEVAATLLTRFVRMMFHDSDLARPNCFEHYNPHTGCACTYRGIDDYQHSYVLDLLIRGIAGLCPPLKLGQPIAIDPLPLLTSEVRLSDARIAGRRINIERSGDQVLTTVDGAMHATTAGQPLLL